MVKTKSQDSNQLIADYPSPLPQSQLPTSKDVLLDSHFNKQATNNNTSFNCLKDQTINRILEVYRKVPQATMNKQNIETKLKNLLADYTKAKKLSPGSKFLQNFL